MDTTKIVVLGAGISAIQSSLIILERHRERHPEKPIQLVLVAKHHAGDEGTDDYASPWAGAHWRPHCSPSTDARESNWTLQTYAHWSKMTQDPEVGKRAGVHRINELFYFDSPTIPEHSLWIAQHVSDYRYLRPYELAEGARSGASFETFAVNVPKYLLYMRKQLEKAGGKFIRKEIPLDQGPEVAVRTAAKAAGWDPHEGLIIVNALGLNGGKLCQDPAVLPIRGQTILLKGEAKRCVTRQGVLDHNKRPNLGHPDGPGEPYITYVIPRPGSGTTILGGTNEANVMTVSEEESDAVTKRILGRVPGLGGVLDPLRNKNGELEIVKVSSGVRPGRTGGPRVEVERFGGVKVVHAYGSGGSGFKNSYGLGQDVSKLVVGEVEEKGRL